MSDDIDRLSDEINAAVGIPTRPFVAPTYKRCAVCGEIFGCDHSLPPVDVDNEVMRMLYAKIGEAAPVYPPCWADFWSLLRGK